MLRYVLEQIGIHPNEDELAELYRVHIAERRDSDCEDMSVLQARLAEQLSPALSTSGV